MAHGCLMFDVSEKAILVRWIARVVVYENSVIPVTFSNAREYISKMYFNRCILHATCIKWSKRGPEVTIHVHTRNTNGFQRVARSEREREYNLPKSKPGQQAI
jgi:hypothetical protein